MKHFNYIILLICYSFIVSAQINSGNPAKPFNSNTNYPNGIMPTNLPTGGTYGQSSDAATAYTTWKSKYVVACGSSSRVLFDDKSSTVSEGIGYGMLLAAYAGDKSLFDGLWLFYKNNMNSHGLMNWKIGGCSGASGQNGATDAELDAAMALLIAEDQWPSASSPYDYISEAKTLIGNIKQYEMDQSSKQAMNGDGWAQGNNRDCRNPSYFAPGYYREFATAIPSDASFWNGAADAADTYLVKNRNASTGLVSNWADPNGTPNTCNGPLEYGYDACRNPWRMAVDVLWHGASAKAGNDICGKIAAWSNNNVGKLKGPINMDGSNSSSTPYANGTFVPSFTVGIMGSSSTYQSHLNACYTASKNINLQYENYFGETLRTIMLFALSGNFWKPGTVTDGGNTGNSVVTTAVTSPSSNASFTQGSAVTITASASSTNNATISNVEFIVDGVTVGSDNTSPYSYSTSTLSAGSHSISVKATDSNTKTATSSAVTITVTATSVVSASLTSPTNGSTANQGSNVTLTANASSTNGASITKVEFIIDGVTVGSDNTSPYSYSTSTLAVGAHTLAVKATDSNNQTFTTGTSAITITAVNNTSVVSVTLSSPTATTYTVGTSVDVAATASSTNNATITKVEFYIDNGLVNTDNASPYSFSTSTLAAGTHSVYAKAYDSNNQSASSATVMITVTSGTQNTPTIDLPQTVASPVIDGKVDDLWDDIAAQVVTKQIVPTISGPADLSGSFKTLWDNNYVYILAEITDDVKVKDSNEPYNDDAVEVYFDINNDKAQTYDNDDVQYTFRWNDDSNIYSNPSGRSTANIQFSIVSTSTGYVFEARVPWSTLQGTPSKGKQIGFDFQVNDDDDGGDRDGKLAWAANSDDAWQNPSLLGINDLTGVVSGIEDIRYSGLKIYPNPFQSSITLEGLSQGMDYSLVDVNGKTVQSGLTHGTIEADIPAGVYNLLLKASDDTFYNLKVVKLH